jgi:hypothetical protein
MWLCFLSVALHYVETRVISAKPARVTVSGSSHFLAIATVSDSTRALPPNLTVSVIRGTRMTHAHTVTGPCFSLGRAIAPFRHGFYATAPAAAMHWGNPGPQFARIVPPLSEFMRLDRGSIPYGETFAVSHQGNLLAFCSPFGTMDCMVTNGFTNLSRKLQNPDDQVTLFALAVGVSPNGSSLATVSRHRSGAVLQIFGADGGLIESFTIPHEGELTTRSKSPFLHFTDERNILLGLPEISRVLAYRWMGNKWIVLRDSAIQFSVISSFGAKQVITLTADGKLQLFDKSMTFKGEQIVGKTLNGGKFVGIAGGTIWVVLVEETADDRRVHFYSTQGSAAWRGVLWFVGFLVLAALMYAAHATWDFGRLFSKASKKKGPRREIKYV